MTMASHTPQHSIAAYYLYSFISQFIMHQHPTASAIRQVCRAPGPTSTLYRTITPANSGPFSDCHPTSAIGLGHHPSQYKQRVGGHRLVLPIHDDLEGRIRPASDLAYGCGLCARQP